MITQYVTRALTGGIQPETETAMRGSCSTFLILRTPCTALDEHVFAVGFTQI